MDRDRSDEKEGRQKLMDQVAEKRNGGKIRFRDRCLTWRIPSTRDASLNKKVKINNDKLFQFEKIESNAKLGGMDGRWMPLLLLLVSLVCIESVRWMRGGKRRRREDEWFMCG